MEHFRAPRHVGRVESATGVARRENEVCGDVVEVSARVDEGMVAEIRFLSQACSATIGAASLLTDRAVGKSVDEIALWSADGVMASVGETRRVRRHAVALALGAIQAAVRGGNAG